jgi:hypothetical protein
MKYAIVALLMAFSITEANAVVYCAVGVFHAGCIHRPGYRAAVVAPVHRHVVVAPRRRYRRY